VTRRNLRPFAFVILVLLPIALFWLIVPDIESLLRTTERPRDTPRWIQDGQKYDYCDQAMSAILKSNKFALVDSARAVRIGKWIIEHNTELLNIDGDRIVQFTPILVERPFPDGQSYLAWAYGEGRLRHPYGERGTVEIVFIDATNGDPLLLIKEMHPSDPTFSCSLAVDYGLSFGLYDGPQSLSVMGVVVSVVYFVIVLVGLILWDHRRHQKSTLP
jgi:hypothetical protein